jgi:hypothetical protein
MTRSVPELCTFCLDEVAPCCHPDCPHGAVDPMLSLERLTPRTPTRPSLVGAAPTRVPLVESRPVPHIGTRPSLTRRPDER